MVVPKSIVRKFLKARRDDHRWTKKLTHKQVDRLLSELRPRPNLHPKFGLHQKVGFYLGVKYGFFAYWYDMGTGKTLLSLELLQYFWENNRLRRALVFVISDKAYSTWERQLRQYKINVPYCSLDGSSEDKWRTLNHFGDGIIFLHYPGTVAMVTGQRPKSRKKKTKSGPKKMVDPTKISRLLKNVDVVIYDESTKAANIGSLTFQVCRAASKQSRNRFALAGMPFGRDPMPLWAQMYLVDHGETLGETLGLFREAFFNEKDNYWGGPYSKTYNFKKSLADDLSEIIQHNSLTYTADECIDLPPVRRITEEVKLSPTIRAYYEEIVGEIISAKGNMKAVKNAFHRMRQLSSGFLGLRDEETGERAEIEFDENPKLDKLVDLIAGLNEKRKAIIFYQYTVSGRRICKELKKQFDIEPIWLWSGTKNPRRAIEDFINDTDRPWTVVQNQLGAYSLDGLQVANYEFFFETPVSVIDRSQAERRIWRQGQLRKSFLYDLVVRDTLDERILEFHKEGKDLFRALLTNPVKLLNKRALLSARTS